MTRTVITTFFLSCAETAASRARVEFYCSVDIDAQVCRRQRTNYCISDFRSEMERARNLMRACVETKAGHKAR